MLATADRNVDGDADSWCSEWSATGRRIVTTAEAAADAGHRVSARAAYRRASAYHALALSAVDGSADPSAVLEPTFRAHRRCFDADVDLLDHPAERVRIPYDGDHMPGYLPRPAGRVGPLPTLVVNNGNDEPITGVWPVLSAGAVARGYAVLVFDGPGQQSVLFDRGIAFRPDWEHVITPVVDFLLARPDVDPDRPGHSRSSTRSGPPSPTPASSTCSRPGVRRCRRRCCSCSTRATGSSSTRFMEEGMREGSPAEGQTFAWRAKPYGTTSPFDTLTAARRYTLEDLARRITTRMLVTDPDGEQFWPGRSVALVAALPGRKHLVRLTAHEGADRHCEPMARTLLEQRMFDWLDEVLGVRART